MHLGLVLDMAQSGFGDRTAVTAGGTGPSPMPSWPSAPGRRRPGSPSSGVPAVILSEREPRRLPGGPLRGGRGRHPVHPAQLPTGRRAAGGPDRRPPGRLPHLRGGAPARGRPGLCPPSRDAFLDSLAGSGRRAAPDRRTPSSRACSSTPAGPPRRPRPPCCATDTSCPTSSAPSSSAAPSPMTSPWCRCRPTTWPGWPTCSPTSTPGAGSSTSTGSIPSVWLRRSGTRRSPRPWSSRPCWPGSSTTCATPRTPGHPAFGPSPTEEPACPRRSSTGPSSSSPPPASSTPTG